MAEGTIGSAEALGEAERVAHGVFGLEAPRAFALAGDTERNFRVTHGPAGARRDVLLRLFVSGLDAERIAFQRALVEHARAADPWLAGKVQGFVPGSPVATAAFGGADVQAALLEFLPGRTLASLPRTTPALLRETGALAGRLGRALSGFEGPTPNPTDDPSWVLLDAEDVVAPRLCSIEDRDRRALAERLFARATGALAHARSLRTSVVHQDVNDHNVLVSAPADDPFRPFVSGLVDFGDAVRTALVADPAIAAAYGALGKRDPLGAMAHLVAGFHAELPLLDDEFEVLFDLALLRLVTSVAISSARASAGAASEYHLVSQRPAWEALERLVSVDPSYATARLCAAAGLEPLRGGADLRAALATSDPAPVLGASLEGAPRVDLSLDSPFLMDVGGPSLDPSSEFWGAAIEDLRGAAPAVVGYHDETRLLYGTDAFLVPREDHDEPRTVHLGVDLFAPAGTAVHAPLAGVVESVRDNAAPLDYGPTLVLRHELGDKRFWTLYGHLAADVLERFAPGDRVERGARIAALGDESVNGGWPPHLHLQIVRDRFGIDGDFPGACAASERDVWLSVSPDPAPLLGLADTGAHEPRFADLLAARRRDACASMSLSYDEPLHIVRGRGTTLWDAGGRAYLDAVNNVPHVGHCHPHVVRAIRRQAGLLNTNTRYLSEVRQRYVEALRARLPEHLEVIYFVSSGSEANEVALRLARAWTSGERRDVLVQEHGYHGHTNGTVRRSHYKFAGPGGFDTPDDVHVVPIADPFRGLHRGPESGPAYVREVEDVIARLARAGRAPMAFLAEAIVGCGGQVVPPAGYLAGAFEAVRRAGGLAIADEVQVGFGRVGTAFWAFEDQGAVPDIVTMGKPIGNAHPLAAVATTRAVAESFAGGMEFFATFGGNDVSMAAGLAVLEVIEREGLVTNARERSAEFMAGLEDVAARSPLVGDVRGRGLYLGVDLVRDRATREPFPAAAAWCANRMRERGVLISTDGPARNVLKIKPPISIDATALERLVGALVATLDEAARMLAAAGAACGET